MKSFLTAAHHLAEVIERENAALTAMDLARAAALLPEKAAAIEALPTQDDAAPRPDRLEAVYRLDALARENRRLLERAMVAQRRVIGIVVKAAAASATAAAYAGPGRPARSTGPMAFSTRA